MTADPVIWPHNHHAETVSAYNPAFLRAARQKQKQQKLQREREDLERKNASRLAAAKARKEAMKAAKDLTQVAAPKDITQHYRVITCHATLQNPTFELLKREFLASGCPFLWSEITSKQRQKKLSVWRQAMSEACTRYLSHSLPMIGRLMGGRDHSTIMHSREKVREARESNLVTEITSPSGFVFYIRKRGL